MTAVIELAQIVRRDATSTGDMGAPPRCRRRHVRRRRIRCAAAARSVRNSGSRGRRSRLGDAARLGSARSASTSPTAARFCWPRTAATLPAADHVFVLTGFRPDLSFLSEMRLELDPMLQAPIKLAPEIDPNVHSCGSVSPAWRRRTGASREPGLYLVGMKSYGRAPTFLALTGYEQVRSVASALAGDHDGRQPRRAGPARDRGMQRRWSARTPPTLPTPAAGAAQRPRQRRRFPCRSTSIADDSRGRTARPRGPTCRPARSAVHVVPHRDHQLGRAVLRLHCDVRGHHRGHGVDAACSHRGLLGGPGDLGSDGHRRRAPARPLRPPLDHDRRLRSSA